MRFVLGILAAVAVAFAAASGVGAEPAATPVDALSPALGARISASPAEAAATAAAHAAKPSEQAATHSPADHARVGATPDATRQPAATSQPPATAPVTAATSVAPPPDPVQGSPAAATTSPAPPTETATLAPPPSAPAPTAPVAETPPKPPAAEPAPTPAVTPAAAAPATPPVPPGEEGLGAEVRRRLAALSQTMAEDARPDAAALTAFYGARKDEPLWVGKTGLNARAVAVIAEIKRAGDWGLDAAAFKTPTLAPAASGGEPARGELAQAEMELSLAMLKYARHARGGRIAEPAKQLSSYLDRLPQLRDPKIVLEEIAAAPAPDAYLRGLHPKHPQFEKLRQKYLAMLASTATVPEVVTIPPGPALVPGQKNPQVALLRARLKVALPEAADGAPDETLYDPALAAAVKAFQSEKGLRADGIVGAGTRAALAEVQRPTPARLLANMEQWRWMPENLGSFYIWVNVPEFLVRVVKDGAVIHEERIISGLTDKQTPVFSDEMELVTFHPRWNVPNSIKVRELYPSLARGGTYFAKQNLKLSKNGRLIDPYSVDWGSADIRNYDVFQPPGATNVLGVVKFSFPNKHDVYMHDTPTKGLFEEASRPFSHGCVRVRNPVRLAEIVLAADKGWTAEQIAEIVNGPAELNEIRLDRTVPVHITYFTAWIDDQGNEQAFKDVYGHEERMSLALEGRFDAIAVGEDHLAPVKYASGGPGYGNTLETFMNNIFGGF